MRQNPQSEPTFAELLNTHFQALHAADVAGRHALIAVQTLNTKIYDSINDHSGIEYFTDADFWREVVEIESTIESFQTTLTEVGLSFATVPQLVVAHHSGEPVPLGKKVSFYELTEDEFDEVERRIKKRLDAVSAEISQTRADFKRHRLPVPLVQGKEIKPAHYSVSAENLDFVMQVSGTILRGLRHLP